MMKYPGSLHNHTQFSNLRLRDCIVTENDLIDYAQELDHEVIAITDHETIASAVRVEKIRKKLKESNPNFKVIMGNEIYLCRDGLNASNFVRGEDKYYHFILLAKDRIGFEQICEISTRAWNRAYKTGKMRRVPTYYSDIIEIIGKNPGHVIASTACLGGFLPTAIMRYKNNPIDSFYGKIVGWVRNMENLFGKGNFYLELQPSKTKEQTYVNRELIKLSVALDVPYIITTDTHYLKKEDAGVHEAFLKAADAGEGDREVKSFYETTYLMSTEELESNLELSREELNIAYLNILTIKNSCEDYSILKPLKIPSLKWKKTIAKVTPEWAERIPMLKTFCESDFEGDKILAEAVIDGINRHPNLANKEAYDEINSNLEMTWISSNVNKAHWSAYYLNLQNIIDLCWQAGSIVGPGRGSGVGFILLYVLDITQINPLAEQTKTFAWRFLNPDRVSVLDVDFDIEGGRRANVLRKFREYYGEDRVANVATFKTEKSKSALVTAARGLGIDNDISAYLASLIPADRGQTRTLKECFYGDAEKGFKPVTPFVNAMTNEYPELWAVAQKIESLICGMGIHAGGVIFVDEPFTKSTALMRAPDDTLITQFDLHDSESVSLIKYDALSVEAMDKLHVALDLLCENNLVEKKATLKETYESVIGIYNLDRTNKEMWKMVWDHRIRALFQMEQQSGIQGIDILKPSSVDDLTILNSTIRLMAQEGQDEMPTEKLARFKYDPTAWDKELNHWGLGQKEKDILEPVVGISYGLCIAQEQFMQLVQLPELGGFSLTWADKLRKSIAKKNPKEFDALTKEFYTTAKERGVKENFARYVWEVLISMSKGYGFNQSHTLAYSLIGLQEMNLAYKFPLLIWDCACLICDSGCAEETTDEEEVVSITEVEDTEEFEYEDLPDRSGKKKKKKATDFGKIAKAICSMKSEGVNISLININTSDIIFKPDVKNNRILYGLKAISGINDEIIEKIVAGRPYLGIMDFMRRCPLGKVPMINLIKAGAFDELDETWAKKINPEPRYAIMAYYIRMISETKNKLTMSNFNGLAQRGLIPNELQYYIYLFNFNKYIKTRKWSEYYTFDDPANTFYSNKYNMDNLEVIEGTICIKQRTWDKIYKAEMENVKTWLTENHDAVLKNINEKIISENWEKSANGNVSSWEMTSLCFYCHDHELDVVDNKRYGIADFEDIENESIERFWKRGNHNIPIYNLTRIAGTVIAKDDNHSTITLLTTTGVVPIKFSKEQYAKYKKQISQKNPDGTKTIVEKGWFSRGKMLLITGFRRENMFVAKTYANTEFHQVYIIDNVINGELRLRAERVGGEEEDI